MTGTPTVQTTIVVPVWDEYVVARLPGALASLRAQEVAAPIVVVDNASEVELPELPDTVSVRSHHRLTLGAARNLGLDQVATPYFVAWDADDLMLPGTLGFLEAAIRSDSRLAAFGSAIIEDPPGARHRWPRRWVSDLMRMPRVFALLDCGWSLYPTTGATIMRTDLARKAGGYADAESGEDWCLGVSLAFQGRVGWSERPGRLYRLDEDSVWARHMTLAHQLRHARNVRHRIRTDSAIPGWVRRALPLIAVVQYCAMFSHLGLSAARRLWGGSDPRRIRRA